MTDTNGHSSEPPRRRRGPTPRTVAPPSDAVAVIDRPDDEVADHVLLPSHVSAQLGGLLTPGEASMEVAQNRRSLGALLLDAKDFRVVRRSPYGLAPLVVLGGISFFQRFDVAAFNLAGPEIAREL